MRDHDVAIVGGYGEVGIHTARHLVRQGHKVLVGGRSPERGRQIMSREGLPVSVEHVDIFDDHSVREFCGSAKIVINTAGPSSAIGDRIAVAALDARSHFVDVGIMEVLDKQMKDRESELKGSGLACIYGTGLHPGLDDIFAQYCDQDAADELEALESLEVFFGDKSAWNGKGSLRDIVWGMHEGALSLYFGFLEKGSFRQAGLFNGFKQMYFQEVGKLRWAMMFQPLLTHLGSRYPRVASWGWYDFSIILSGLWTKYRYRPGSEAGVEYMYRKIVERNQAYADLETDTFLFTVVKGKRKETMRELEYRVVLPRDRGYWVVGIVPALTADWLLSGRIDFRGAGGLGNIVEPRGFMQEMSRLNVRVGSRERASGQRTLAPNASVQR